MKWDYKAVERLSDDQIAMEFSFIVACSYTPQEVKRLSKMFKHGISQQVNDGA
jgi:hypothetical protein